MSHKIKKRIVDALLLIIIFIILIASIYPVFWIARTSFARYAGFDKKFEFSLVHYFELFQKHDFHLFIKNSLLISIISTLVVIIIGIIAAYAFARIKFRGKNNIAFWIISTRFLPPIIFVVPIYVLFSQLKLINNYLALIMVYITFNIPLVVWLLRGYIIEIPVEIEESAMVDGCSRISLIFKIIMPMITPGLVATSILAFIFSWNEYLFALVLTGNATRTLPVAVTTFQADKVVFWGPLCAGSFISIVPIILLTILIQKNLVKGLTLGAIK